MTRYRFKRGFFSFLKVFFLLLLMFIIAFPFWQLIVSSLLKTNVIISYPPKFRPSGGSLANYIEVLTMQNGAYLRWMLNSIFTAFTTTALAIFFCTMAGYAFAKREFPGKQIIFIVIIAT